jgi:hypothetical protein
MTQCFRRDAADQAAACAGELQAAGEVDACAMWKRIGRAIEQLQSGGPAEGAAIAIDQRERPADGRPSRAVPRLIRHLIPAEDDRDGQGEADRTLSRWRSGAAS